MHTFAVSDVTPATALLGTTTLADALARRLAEPLGPDELSRGPGDRPESRPPPKIEASGANVARLVTGSGAGVGIGRIHPVIEAVHTAFAEHYPLVLSPDDVWLCLAQGLARHVEAHPEALRSRFVRHEGKLELQLRRDDFVLGAPDNDWQGCFAEWSDAIAAHLGKKRDLIVAAFSTTGPIERAASELVLMSSMKSYFDFTMMTLCGIPSITLAGTVEDWRSIRRRAEVLAELDLADWVTALLPVLDEFVASASGRPDRAFWQSMYKHRNMSGGPYVTGWINVLFPYLDQAELQLNPYATGGPGPGDNPNGAELDTFPHGLSSVPLAWEYLGAKLSMTLSGGFVGISQDPETLALRPAIGWVVQHAEPGG